MSAADGTTTRGWWRRNALWLLLLPVVVAAAAAASSLRLVNLWWPTQLIERVDAVGGDETARFVGEYYDLGLDDPARANTWVTREVEVRVLGVEQVNSLPDTVLSEVDRIPDGSAAWRVDLELTAEPGTDLTGCQVVLVTPDGTRYGDAGRSGVRTDPLGQGSPCLPEDSLDAVAPEAGTWESSTVLLTRVADEPEQVWLAFGTPHYVTLDVP